MLQAIPSLVVLSERLATAGQPSEEQLAAVAAAGFKVVIKSPYSLRSIASCARAGSERKPWRQCTRFGYLMRHGKPLSGRLWQGRLTTLPP